MDVVCEVCGAIGFKHLLVQCNKCKDSTRHRGIMKIDQKYISLAAHLSNKACKKVLEVSISLPPVMKVTKHSKLKAWPSRWKESEPTAESIALPDKDLDLVQHVTVNSLVLKYVVGCAKLLIFPSVFLPKKFQIVHGKHYLWGVFRPRKVMSKGGLPLKNQDCISQDAKKTKDQQDKVQVDTLDQEKHVLPVKEQVSASQGATKRKVQQDEVHRASQAAKKRKVQQDEVQVGTLNREKPVTKHNIRNDDQPSPDTVNGVNTETKRGDDGKAQSSSEAPAPMVFGVIDLQTPKSQQLFRELSNEGAWVHPVS